LKKLRRKDNQQIELEKREQGFALYVNGANLSKRQGSGKISSVRQNRPSKTAGLITQPSFEALDYLLFLFYIYKKKRRQ